MDNKVNKGRKVWCIILFCISIIGLLGCQIQQDIIVDEENEYKNVRQDCETESANSIDKQKNESVSLSYIPELGYRDTMTGGIEEFNDYVYWKDILVIGNDIYKKENGSYRKSNTVSNWLGLENKWVYGIRQYDNMLITPTEDNKGFVVFNMDTEERKEYMCEEDGSHIVWWYILGNKIYYDKRYNEKEQYCQGRICTIDLLDGKEKVVYSRDDLGENRQIFKFKIRENGDILVEICEWKDNDGRYYISNREYWLVTYDGEQMVEQIIWKTDELQYEYWLDFNASGLFILGNFYQWDELNRKEYVINMSDTGEIVKKEGYETSGSYYFTDNGYYTEDKMENAEEVEAKRGSYDARNMVDSVSKYDYEGNKIGTYRLVEEDILDEGWYLSLLLCEDNKITAFYKHGDTDELYISQVDVE